ncbi:MAG: dihydropteroate synthase [Candidatus Devosia euplotis]|nr:dihydropteroate synthase [Candidatus Devosia euplotis]
MHSTHTITLPGRSPLQLGQTPLVMGILNVTPDSFSDGGHHNLVEHALSHARQMLAEGADIIDIGGESTRPDATPVHLQEELDRVLPVIDALIAEGIAAPISIDTYKPLVADQAIQAGACLINDVHGLQGAPEMADVAALYGVPVVAMHWDKARDTGIPPPEAMHRYFQASITRARQAGISDGQLIVDPGFGFGKSLAENYAILQNLRRTCSSSGQTDGDFAILVGVSRKSMIGKLLDVPPGERLAGTIASTVLAYANGGHIFRVHDVKANRDALRVAQATLYGPPADLR